MLVRLLVLLFPFAAAVAAEPDHSYGVDYYARFLPDAGVVHARVVVTQPVRRLVTLDFNAPETRYDHFEGDGKVTRDGDRVIWDVPEEGGELRYRMQVDHRRSGALDSAITRDWAVLRLDDVFPPVRARSRRSSQAHTRLYLAGPKGWSFETPYGPVHQHGVAVDTRGRRFDRPLGWLAAGVLGIRRTLIDGRRIAVAGPRDQGMRRMDLLVFLRWTLPGLAEVAPSLPERVLIVGGGRDMWRGGLSGPGSLYLHPDRPLVSGNSTSTVLHELMHVAMREPPEEGADWVVEGLAEYYSLVVLMRTGGISGHRFQHSLDWLKDWAGREHGKLADPSTGADTARAVLLFRDLDLELRQAGSSLDRVTPELLSGRVGVRRLGDLVAGRLGHPSKVLAPVLAGD